MKRLLGLLMLVLFLWPATARAAVALCAISGQVFNPDGTTLNNGTVQFNSQVTQVVGSTTIPPSIISTTTDATGNMAPMSVAQGLFGTFTFCQGHSSTNVGGSGGGCAAAINGLIPINTTGNIQAVIAGTLLPSVGNATVNNLTVTNNTMVGGTLQVSGLSTLNSLTVTPGATSLTTLNVSGAITGSALITAPSLSLTTPNCGAVTFAKAQMSSIPSAQDWIVAAGAHCTGTSGWTADANSAVLFGNYTFATGPVDNAGWQWLGDTGLTVGGTYTPTLTMSLATAPAYIALANHVGVLSVGSLRLNNGSTTALQFGGGSIASVGTSNMNYYAGAHYNGSVWVADATTSLGFSEFVGGPPAPTFEWIGASGLTVGVGVPYNIYGLLNSNGWTLNGTNPVAIFQSNTNVNADVLEVFPQNQTQGIGIAWSGIHSIGANANVSMTIDSKGAGASICLDCNNPGAPIFTQANIDIQNNWHFNVTNNGVTPSLASCVNGSMYGGSTDNAGQVDFVASGATSCLINFARGYGANPICVCNVFTSSSPPIISSCMTSVNPGQLDMWFSAAVQNNTAYVNWVCIGNG